MTTGRINQVTTFLAKKTPTVQEDGRVHYREASRDAAMTLPSGGPNGRHGPIRTSFGPDSTTSTQRHVEDMVYEGLTTEGTDPDGRPKPSRRGCIPK
jgi:hypothetical protein